MSEWKKVKPEEWEGNTFSTIGKDWMLIGAKSGDKVNAMTASWGGFGILWNRPVAYVFIRKSRFTKELVENSGEFTLTVFDHEKNAQMLGYMGKSSGRSEDKIANAGLTVENLDGQPVFEEAKLAMTCRVLCCQPVEMNNLRKSGIEESFYKDKDYHDMYVGEIVGIYVK